MLEKTFVMQPETRMLYKLIILYILDKVDFPMTNVQITNFLLEKDYTTYFNTQQTLSDLVDDEFIRRETLNNTSMYRITDSGRETLSFFQSSVSLAIRTEIDQYISENRYNLREEVSAPAEYFEVKQNEYIARLQVLERGLAIIDLNLIVSSKEAADHICTQWKKKSSDIYGYIISSLLFKGKPKEKE